METPAAERLHIAILGARNSGKSSLVNAMAGQTVSLVSGIPGTTTDPVSKAMEIPGAGATVLIDTAGFDDEGELGALRVNRTGNSLDKADIAILLFRDGSTGFGPDKISGRRLKKTGIDDTYREWYRILSDKGIRVIPVLNTCAEDELSPDTEDAGLRTALKMEIEKLTGLEPVTVNAATGAAGQRSTQRKADTTTGPDHKGTP